jgi:hypothetical protein
MLGDKTNEIAEEGFTCPFPSAAHRIPGTPDAMGV